MKNWAGNFTYSTSTVHEAGSADEISDLISRYPRLKVLGTRHCFNDIADSKDRFILLSGMRHISEVDPATGTVTVEAGVRYGDLATWLHERGYALHNLASLPHISVAGGCITATHGSGVRNGNLATAVRGIEWVTATGERKRLRMDRDGEEFLGAVVNLGGLGVIVRMTLSVEPAFQVCQTVYEDLPWTALKDHFDPLMAAGYSVSLFTGWRGDSIDTVWVKQKAGQPQPSDLFDARAAKQKLHPIRGIGAEHCTDQLGLPGPWHERLPHFRMGFTPSSGEELQSEYFVPAGSSYPALMAVRELRERIAPHLLVSEIRSVAADELWMSPCYERASTAIHFTWKPDWPAVQKLLPLIEERLAPFDARPHWGKLFTTGHTRLCELYPKFTEFTQLLTHCDPARKFGNEWLDKLIFGLPPLIDLPAQDLLNPL